MKEIKHIPLQPPRASVPMEGIYLSLWQAFAERNPDDWAGIFRDCNFTPRQRAASVAASFMVFMGCNGGRDFTHRAEQFANSKTFAWPEPAYIAAWALENNRSRGINSGLRCIEYMLASQHPIQNGSPLLGRVNWQAVPAITMEDLDVIECMVRWWSGTTARVIRDKAAALLEAHKANERLDNHLKDNAAFA